MKIKFHAGINNFFPCCIVTERDEANPEKLDLREEYAKAFRSESYNDFWAHVLALNKGHRSSLGSTTAARLSSYRLFAEHLLDPDQTTATRMLSIIPTNPKILSLLSDYFSNTSDASHLCGLLLKDVDNIRRRFKSLKEPFLSNPFSSSAPSMIRFQAVQSSCSDLLKQLETRRDKTQSKICRLKKLKCGSAVFVVCLTSAVAVIVAAHALVIIVAAPMLMPFAPSLSIQKLVTTAAQVDAAAKGTYILIRDLETIGRLVARLNNELERHQLWHQRGRGEVASQLNKNTQTFFQQLDDLEEHLYLCFITINRSRNLVTKQILKSGNSTLNSSPK